MSPMVSIVSENNNKFDNSFNVKRYELIKLRKYIETNFEYVGENFSNKVREIYYDKNSKKTIYGTTTVEERVELAEEGIDLISVPWIKDN